MPVAAITFDADQTLWDFAGVYRRALTSTRNLMIERGDIEADAVSLDDLREIRDELTAASRGRPHDLGAIRKESLLVALRTVDHPDPEPAAQLLAEHYLRIRFETIELYNDVRTTLHAIQAQVPIGLITNGNTDPERCGLPGVFDVVVMGPDHGLEKPDRRMFELAANQLGVEPSELGHVGDDDDDIDGINQLDGVSVLIERDGPRHDLRDRADHTVQALTGLPALLDLGAAG